MTDEAGAEVVETTEIAHQPVAHPPAQRVGAMVDFLDQIASPEAMDAQRQLSKAYSDYCHAILDTDTDMQEIEGKAFKKKSAWRKLGRAFQVSTEIVRREGYWEDDEDEGVRHYVAHYEVRATAPWGQYVEAEGSCSTRESRFYTTGVPCPVCGGPTWDNRAAITGEDKNAPAWKKNLPPFTCRDKSCNGEVRDMDAETQRRPNRAAMAKAEHDVRATAQTRATNRAISDLIAAGEVSAEEVSGETDHERGKVDDPITDEQIERIRTLADEREISKKRRMALLGETLNGFTRSRAADAIAWLEDQPYKNEVAPA